MTLDELLQLTNVLIVPIFVGTMYVAFRAGLIVRELKDHARRIHTLESTLYRRRRAGEKHDFVV